VYFLEKPKARLISVPHFSFYLYCSEIRKMGRFYSLYGEAGLAWDKIALDLSSRCCREFCDFPDRLKAVHRNCSGEWT